MTTNEEFLAKNIILYTGVGLALRFVLYGLPRSDLIWLYLVLSLLVGFGCGGIAWGRKINNHRIFVFGILIAVLGLLPLHYVF
ncbi:MAG: hypothetical protein ACTSUO_03175 [Candidatus Thorarchaeota archaeon]